VAKGVSTRDQRMRQMLIQESARIIAEEGVKDYLLAKRKAADRLGASATQNMPGNQEIQDAVLEYQRLFLADAQRGALERLRRGALEAMAFFERFRPRLVGPVLDGSASPWSEINLHVFADTSEEVAVFLLDAGIPFEALERRLRISRDTHHAFPGFRFMAGEQRVELTVFTAGAPRRPPLSQIDGQPMDRANRERVERLLGQDRGWSTAAP
jgi:hypothetical protein